MGVRWKRVDCLQHTFAKDFRPGLAGGICNCHNLLMKLLRAVQEIVCIWARTLCHMTLETLDSICLVQASEQSSCCLRSAVHAILATSSDKSGLCMYSRQAESYEGIVI